MYTVVVRMLLHSEKAKPWQLQILIVGLLAPFRVFISVYKNSIES